MDLGPGHRVDQRVEGADVLRVGPPVDTDRDDLGAPTTECLAELGHRLPLLLNGDPPTVEVPAEELVEDLGDRLGAGRPRIGQAGPPDGAACLRPAGQHLGGSEPAQQALAPPSALGGVQPAPETHTGDRHHQVHRGGEHRIRRGREPVVVGEGDAADRRPVHHAGSSALQQPAQFLGPAGRRHPHGQPEQRAVVLRHRPILVSPRPAEQGVVPGSDPWAHPAAHPAHVKIENFT